MIQLLAFSFVEAAAVAALYATVRPYWPRMKAAFRGRR